MNKKNVLKKTTFTILAILAAVCLFMISCSITAGAKTGLPFVCAVIFMICTAAVIAIFIIDREKPLWFAVIYIAAILIGIFLPLIKAFAG